MEELIFKTKSICFNLIQFNHISISIQFKILRLRIALKDLFRKISLFLNYAKFNVYVMSL